MWTSCKTLNYFSNRIAKCGGERIKNLVILNTFCIEMIRTSLAQEAEEEMIKDIERKEKMEELKKKGLISEDYDVQ